MNKLLIISLLLTGCTTAKFSRGDCITPNPDALESWQDSTQMPTFTALVLNTGKRYYRIVDTVVFNQTATGKIKEVDEDFMATECPIGVDMALQNFPDTTK